MPNHIFPTVATWLENDGDTRMDGSYETWENSDWQLYF